jgi:hypothetical protein
MTDMRLVDARVGIADSEERARLVDLLRRLARERDFAAALRTLGSELRAHFDADVSTGANPAPLAPARSDDEANLLASERSSGRRVVEHISFDDRELAVLALRRERPFTAIERTRFAWFASLVAPVLAGLALERELEERAAQEHTAIRPDVARLFRGEALEQYQRGRTDEAHPLELEPKWTRFTYRLLLALFAAALLFTLFVRVDRHADGVGIVRNGRLVAFLPARARTELQRNQVLRFEYSNAPARIATIGPTIVAATTARRLLGEDGPRLWRTTGPAIRIEAPIPSADVGEGVTGRVRVQLGRERLLFVLIPPLRGRA